MAAFELYLHVCQPVGSHGEIDEVRTSYLDLGGHSEFRFSACQSDRAHLIRRGNPVDESVVEVMCVSYATSHGLGTDRNRMEGISSWILRGDAR